MSSAAVCRCAGYPGQLCALTLQVKSGCTYYGHQPAAARLGSEAHVSVGSARQILSQCECSCGTLQTHCMMSAATRVLAQGRMRARTVLGAIPMLVKMGHAAWTLIVLMATLGELIGPETLAEQSLQQALASNKLLYYSTILQQQNLLVGVSACVYVSKNERNLALLLAGGSTLSSISRSGTTTTPNMPVLLFA